MIVVKTLDEFQQFIELAKQQNITYSVIGSEKEDYVGVMNFDNTPQHNKFICKYALLSPSFTVFLAITANLEDKEKIQAFSSSIGFKSFKSLYLKDGTLFCNN